MRQHWRALFAVSSALVSLLVVAPRLSAAPFSRTSIIIEVNATAGDGGIQISLDAEGWNSLEVIDPNRREVLEVEGTGGVGKTGITELFFESAEPSFEDLPLDQLLERFPSGNYRFFGTTVHGKQLTGRAMLSHSIPAAANVVSPVQGSAVDPGSPVIVDWDPVTGPYPGTNLPVTIGGYQVIVERVSPQPLLVFSVFLPAHVTRVTVPAEFLQENAEYKFEVLAIEASGNQTITESDFTTAGPGGLGSALPNGQGRALGSTGGGGLDGAGVAFLRQNGPNPFNPVAALEFGLPRGGPATVRVFDVHGRVVRTLVNGRLPAGQHRATWDGNDTSGRPVGSGVYVAQLAGPGVLESKKLILAR